MSLIGRRKYFYRKNGPLLVGLLIVVSNGGWSGLPVAIHVNNSP